MTLVSTFVGSVILTVILGIFKIWEVRRGNRVLENVRSRIDAILERGLEALKRRFVVFGNGVVMQTLHYAAHNFIEVMLTGVHRAEDFLMKLLHVNREKALAKRTEASSTYLKEVARHKEEVALNEEEKERRKEEALHS